MEVAQPNVTMATQSRPYEITWTGEVLFRVVTIILVMVLTLVGNTSLILIITCHPAERRKRVNVFLANLALGDLMVCVFTMTTEILFVAFGEWVLGAVACKVIVYGQIVTLSSAVFLLTAMGVDRYQVLVRPLRSLAGRPCIWKKVASAWVLSFLVAIPQLFIFVQTDEGYHVDGTVRHLCRSQGYTAKWQRKVYFTFLTTYILVIPTIVMSFCYMNIIRVIWRRTDSNMDATAANVTANVTKTSFHFRRKSTTTTTTTTTSPREVATYAAASNGSGPWGQGRQGRPGTCPSFSSSSSPSSQNRLRLPKKLVSSSKRNVVKMTLSVIVGFLVCWTPYFVVSLCRIYSDYQLDLKVALAVAEVMALVHSAMNPIFYVIFCTRHAKAALLRMTRCCLHARPPQLEHPLAEDGTASEDDTTWAEGRRFSSELRQRNRRRRRRCPACCCRFPRPRWLCACACPCVKPPSSATRGRDSTLAFYQELIPNGAARQLRGSSLATEVQLSDCETGDFDSIVTSAPQGGSSGRGGEARQTFAYVMANPHATSLGQEVVSAL